MPLEEIKKILQNGKESTTNPEFHKLAKDFEEFMDLFSHHREALKKPPEEAALFLRRLGESQQKVQQSFEKTCAVLGMTPAQFREHFENPNHFTQEQWAQLEQVKIQSNEFLANPAPQKVKKQRRRHLKAASKI